MWKKERVKIVGCKNLNLSNIDLFRWWSNFCKWTLPLPCECFILLRKSNVSIIFPLPNNWNKLEVEKFIFQLISILIWIIYNIYILGSKMPFARGVAPIRRTIKYLESSPLVSAGIYIKSWLYWIIMCNICLTFKCFFFLYVSRFLRSV